jgi:hypothetical protein
MGKFSEYIGALVCGLPKAVRERVFLAMLVAYFDDSGSGKEGPVMVLAGWIARFTPWMDFSDRWEELLNETPRLGYFKLKEAIRLEEQFGRLKPKQRNDRVFRFCSTIEKYAGLGIVASFRWDDLKTAQAECPPEMELNMGIPMKVIGGSGLMVISVPGSM